MGKYLILWETDESKVPLSPQDRGDRPESEFSLELHIGGNFFFYFK